jgi:hypothetical protein
MAKKQYPMNGPCLRAQELILQGPQKNMKELKPLLRGIKREETRSVLYLGKRVHRNEVQELLERLPQK